MTIHVLCLDLGTNTGFAYGDGTVTLSGSWDLQQTRYQAAVVRILNFMSSLDTLYKTCNGIDQVFYEEVRRHRSTDAAHWYGAFMMRLHEWCHNKDIPYDAVPVGTIKKFATGSGNASKEDVIAATKRWGFNPADDDEADALALLRYVQSQHVHIEAQTA